METKISYDNVITKRRLDRFMQACIRELKATG